MIKFMGRIMALSDISYWKYALQWAGAEKSACEFQRRCHPADSRAFSLMRGPTAKADKSVRIRRSADDQINGRGLQGRGLYRASVRTQVMGQEAHSYSQTLLGVGGALGITPNLGSGSG